MAHVYDIQVYHLAIISLIGAGCHVMADFECTHSFLLPAAVVPTHTPPAAATPRAELSI